MSVIAVLTPWVSREGGGLQDSVKDLVVTLASVPEYSIEVLSFADRYSEADKVLWGPVPVRMFPFVGPDNFRFSLPFLRAVLSLEADLIQLHGIWMFHAAALSLRMRTRDTPTVISPHGMLDPWIVKRHRGRKAIAELLFERYLRTHASTYRALNVKEARAIRAVSPTARITIIPNGVELPTDWVQSSTLSLESSERRILFLGRLHEKKCVLELIWAIEQIWSTTRYRPRLEIAGWGDSEYVNNVKIAIENAPKGSCLYLGPLHGEEKAEAFRRCDAFVLPSHSEGLPMAVLEACSYGRPALISAGCNLEDLVADRAAIEIEISPDRLASGIRQFCEQPAGELNEIGQRARKVVEDRYTWSRVSAMMQRLNNALLQGNEIPAEISFGER